MIWSDCPECGQRPICKLRCPRRIREMYNEETAALLIAIYNGRWFEEKVKA